VAIPPSFFGQLNREGKGENAARLWHILNILFAVCVRDIVLPSPLLLQLR
jgi:hypothetical protein